MDTLALLCTLHADGPASLQRLRAADLCSIDDVLGCSVETTADVLGLSMAQARRFHREARMLAMRMHTEGLDREERMYPGATDMGTTVAQPAPGMAAATQSTPVMPATPTPSDRPYPHGDSDDIRKKPDIAAILAPVLKQWEHEDAKTSATESLQPAVTPLPATETTPPGADELECVDDQLREALRVAGYATLAALADVDPLELSRAMGRTYSEACRLRFLAQRAIEEGAATEVPATPPTDMPPTGMFGMQGTDTPDTPDTPETTDTPPTEPVDTLMTEMFGMPRPDTPDMPPTEMFGMPRPDTPDTPDTPPTEMYGMPRPEMPGTPPTDMFGMPITEPTDTSTTEPTETSDTSTIDMFGMLPTETSDTLMVEHGSTFEVTDPPDTPSHETSQEFSGGDDYAKAEAERILAELAENEDSETDRFSPAPPERKYPEDPPAESCAEEEGPGGPFA